MATGHFHISKIQDETKQEDLNAIEINKLIDIVKKGIEQGIKGI